MTALQYGLVITGGGGIGMSTAAPGASYALLAHSTFTLGVPGTIGGSFQLAGGTSGTVSILPQPSAGTYNFNLPTTAGNVNDLFISQGGGSNAIQWQALSTYLDNIIGNTQGSLITRDASTWQILTPGTAGYVLSSQGASANLIWEPAGGAGAIGTFGTSTTSASPYIAGDLTSGMYSASAANISLAISGSNISTWSATGQSMAGGLTLTAGGDLNLGSGSLINISGASGTITIQPQSAAGTYNFNLPTTAGSAGQVLTSQGGLTAAMTWTSGVTTATASTIMSRDASANTQINSIIENATTTATAAGTTTLTVASSPTQQFTGVTTQTVVLPNATTLIVGQQYTIFNRSTGTVTVQTNGGATLQAMLTGTQGIFTVLNIGTTAGTWDTCYTTTFTAAGTLQATAGGTGLTTAAANSLLFWNSTSTISTFAAANGGIVNYSSAGIPSSTATPTLGVNAATAGTLALAAVVAGGGSITLANIGTLAAGAYTFVLPTTVGTAGQFLTSSGSSSTAMTWSSPLTWQTVQAAGFTAVANRGYPVNTTSASITALLPTSPVLGQQVWFVDYAGTFDTNNLIVSPNGSKINGSVVSATCSIQNLAVLFTYIDTTKGWLATADAFNGTAPFVQTVSANFLIAAGGGSGGTGTVSTNSGGGGGAGGLITGTASLTVGTNYPITVGTGGTSPGSLNNVNGNNGNNSVFNGQTAIGGGGGSAQLQNSNAGGSSGGCSYQAGTPGSNTPGQGNLGGAAPGTTDTSSGGGGAGGAGGIGAPTISGNGGGGTVSSITGSSVTYCGGGAGGEGDQTSGSTNGGGGTSGNNGTNALGGGGGGGGPAAAGAGGNGVVILSIPTANYSGTTTGSPTVTTSGANTILKFTSSGSYTA